ncbi:hypothetical protein SLS58_006287 [Diplodia intermedia]|uniref:Fucose-specific lectin n=1 Tax=Diplodia intermedia TaxID=856260 RepID=A0ABR3TNF3_9PEZI
MRSGPPVPPKDSSKAPLTTESPLKRDPAHSYKRISATTNTSSKDLDHPHLAYAESNQNHILPEAVLVPDNHDAHNDEKTLVSADKPPHGSFSQDPEVSYAELTHGGPPPQAHLELENYPQIYNESLPEALNRDRRPPYALETTDEKASTRKICGLRRLWFWIILVAAILIAAIVAIVGGVLGSRAAKGAKADTSFLPTGALAAVNYTEGNGIQHRRLYFQGESNALYQSAWNSSTQEWHVSPLNPRDASGPSVRPGTPLAAYTKNDGTHAAIEYHIFFLDNDNKIWERGSYDPDDMWGEQTSNTLNGTLFAGNNSKLAAYGQQCDRYCVQTSLVAYEDYESKLWWAAYISDYGWYAQAAKADSNHSLVTGSSLSMAPIWNNDSSLVALYANTGTLTRFTWYQLTAWEDSWSYDRKL